MYLLGVFHDIRFLSAAFLPFLLCGFLSLIFSNIKINNKLVIYSKNFVGGKIKFPFGKIKLP